MNDKDQKVVNTEEQNRAVNPSNSEYQESAAHEEPVVNDKNKSSGENEKPNDGSEADTPRR